MSPEKTEAGMPSGGAPDRASRRPPGARQEAEPRPIEKTEAGTPSGGVRKKLRLPAVLLICAGILAISPFLGPPLAGERAGFIFWQLRVPRLCAAILAGGSLSLVGAVYQTIFSNPLAAPGTVGTTAGATLGALAALLFGAGVSAGVPVVALSAFAGALLVSMVITGIASSGRAGVQDVLLAGIAVSLAAGALAAGLQYASDMGARFSAIQWSLGHLQQAGYRGILMMLPFVVPSALVLLSLRRALDALAPGEQKAHSLGVDVPRVRALSLGVGALAVGAVVAWCGPLAFVGMIVPHLVRLTLGAGRRVLLPMSWIVGAAFLALCDAAGRLILPGRELPVGVITALVGAPALVFLVWRARKEGA